MSNYGMSNSKRLAGAGRTPDLLRSLSKASLTERCGCAMHFKKKTTGHYLGMVEPGKKCLVPRDGKLTYLVSEVEVDQENWVSRDRGYDPETDSQMWGSEHGLLKFKRVAFLSDVIADEWITHLS
jgi:CpeT protein